MIMVTIVPWFPYFFRSSMVMEPLVLKSFERNCRRSRLIRVDREVLWGLLAWLVASMPTPLSRITHFSAASWNDSSSFISFLSDWFLKACSTAFSTKGWMSMGGIFRAEGSTVSAISMLKRRVSLSKF